MIILSYPYLIAAKFLLYRIGIYFSFQFLPFSSVHFKILFSSCFSLFRSNSCLLLYILFPYIYLHLLSSSIKHIFHKYGGVNILLPFESTSRLSVKIFCFSAETVNRALHSQFLNIIWIFSFGD